MSRRSRTFSYIRLAGFPLGLGLALVLVSGTLNRVMIVELDLPAALVGLFFAVAFLVAPARAWLGYVSDGFPIRGKRREPYIVLGALVASLAILAATFIVLNADGMGVVLVGGALVAFLAYALGYTLASNTFEALLADTFTGTQRPRAVTSFKVVMFAGIMLGAIGLGRALDPFSEARLVTVVAGVMLAFVLLALGAVWRQEPPNPHLDDVSRSAAATPFWQVIRDVVWADLAARRFFMLIVLAVLGTLAQDVLLEPYGALVLDMTVAQTTRLTAIWGSGTILAMLLSGARLIPRWGYMRALRVGLLVNVVVFPGIILVGAGNNVPAFMGLVFMLGLGTGLSMAGLLTAVIEFTTFARAGLLMGVWGMAAEFGQTMGGLLGGIMVDAVLWVSGDSALMAYGTVFAVEGLLLVVALALSFQVRVGVGLKSGGLAEPGDPDFEAMSSEEVLSAALWS